MAALVSSAAVIAAERSTGWTRQMRITPLHPARTSARRCSTATCRALLTIAVLCLAGTALGVRLSATEWLTMIGLLLVGPRSRSPCSASCSGTCCGPIQARSPWAAIVTLFALLGGVYGFQIATSGAMFDVIKALPSYWLVQAGKTALGHGGWPAEGWIVIAAWTVVLTVIAVFVYQRDPPGATPHRDRRTRMNPST